MPIDWGSLAGQLGSMGLTDAASDALKYAGQQDRASRNPVLEQLLRTAAQAAAQQQQPAQRESSEEASGDALEGRWAFDPHVAFQVPPALNQRVTLSDSMQLECKQPERRDESEQADGEQEPAQVEIWKGTVVGFFSDEKGHSDPGQQGQETEQLCAK